MSGLYFDEEECLGFPVWVAELELLVGNARGKKKVDPRQCFQLLQKLVVTLDRTGRLEVREYQRRCEDALIDILLKGAPPPARKLICEALGKLYSLGDQLPLYSRVSSLQLFLGTKEAFSREQTSEDVRLGALECMASLYYSQGRFLSIGVNETTALAVKYCLKSNDEKTRCAALALLAAAVEGVGATHRNASAVQQDALKTAEKLAKDRDSVAIRLASAGVLRALAHSGGACLWASGLSGYDDARAACLAALEDPSHEVRTAFAQALGDIVVASSSDAATDSVKALERANKPKQKLSQERALGEVVAQCLVTPFVEGSVASNRTICTALAQAWVTYLTAVRGSEAGDAAAFVDRAMRVIDMLGAACSAAGSYQERALVQGEGELGMGIGSGERPHAQACVLYVLRVGVIEQLGEQGQRLLLDKLTAVLAAPLGSHTPVAVVTLEAMALLLEVLGEVSTESGAALQEPIFSKLSGPHQCLRLQAATCLATLTIAEPSSAARHLQTALTQLRQAVTTLVDATTSSAPDRSKPVAPSTPRGVGVAKLKPAMDAVHGWALGTAALLAASVRLPLGVPAALATSALQLAAGLISAPRSQQASAASSEREAGYILLGSLCRSLPSQLLLERQLQLLDLFGPALGQEASTQLESHFGSSSSSLDHLVAAELWWRTSALQALLAYVQGVVLQAPKADQARLCKKVAAFLKPLLDVISSHAALQEPARGKGGPTGMFAGAAALLQLRLLEVYLALPAPNAYILEHEALTKLSMRTVRSVAVAGALPMAESALRPWLDSADTLLGPWPLGQDPLETALLSFEGVAGAPAIQPWEAGLREGLGYAMVEDSEGGGNFQGTTCAPYPQPKALGAALLEAQLSLLGTLLAAVSAPNQAAIVEALLSIAEGGPQKKKDKDPQRRQVAAAIVAAAALAGLRKLQKAGKAAAPPELALRVKALADEVAEESSSSPALQRAAADLYAAAAALAPDNTLAVQLVKALCKEAASTASLSRRATLALAVGSVSSAVGGLSLQAVLPLAVQTLIAVAEASDKSICLWILQALLACANAAGLAFVPHVKPTLGLAQDVLLAEDIYSTPGLLPAIGRLANAMVAVLGPEYSLGSAAYIACKSIMNDMRPGEAGGLWASESPIDEVTAALERVLYTQMLVLFAPKAVPAKSHVQVLVHTLLSRQPRLRKAAADTLRHLAERDAHSVLPEQVEPALFAALDGETDPTIASQLKSTLRTLLVAGAPAEPSRWLALCGDVVMAAAPGTTAMHVSPSKASLESGAGRGDGDDDDEESSAAAAPPPAPAPHAGSAAASPGEGMGSAAVRSSAKAGLTPRLRTRLFAAKCLLQIPGLVCSTDPRHSDLAAAQASGGGDWLVLRLQLLVDMGFKMASGQLEALRPLGVKLMKAAVKRFADTADPLAEGQRLLELYQAQVVSAIRASLSAGASPTLQAAGATLAALFLEEGLAGGDATVLERLMSLLAAPVAQWGSGNQPEQLYAEWVDVRAKVALLEAHAHCAVLAAGSADGATARVVSKAQAPLAEALLDSWLGLLEDYVVLVSQPAAIQLAYRPKLCTASSAATTTATASAAAGTGSAGAPGLGVIPEEGQEAAAGSPAVADGMEQAQGGEQAAAAAPSVQQPGQALSGAPLVAILAAVRRYLQRAWPAALDACTCLLEQQLQEQQQQQQQQPSAPAPLRTARAAERYQALLDICQMCVCDATEPEGASGGAHLAWAAAGSAGAARKGGRGRNGSAAVPGGLQGGLAAALKALERLTGSAFVAVGLLSLEEVAELTALLMALLRQVLAPAASLHHGSSSSSGRNGRQEQSAGGAEAVQRTARVLCQLATAIGSLAGGEGSRAVDPHPLAATALQQLLAAAEECIALAVPGFDPAPAGDSSAALDAHGNGSHPGADSYAALAGVLDPALACAKLTLQAAVGHAASMPDTFVPLLHRSLGLGTALLAAARQAEQLAAGSGYLVDLAAIVGPALQAGSPAGSSMPSPLTVLAGAGASLAQQAQQLTAAGGQAPSARLGATLAAIMPLAGAVAASRPGSSTVAATAPPAAAASGAEDDWGDDAFESAAPSAAAATEAEAQAGGGSEPGEVGATSNADGPGLAATVVANGLEGTSAATEHADATAAGGEASQAEATLQLCLAALQAAAESSDLSVAIAVLQALRGPLQQLSSAQQQPGALQWPLRCAAVVLPPAAARVHGLVQGERALGELQVQAVAETLKVALLAATTSSSTGEASQAPFMQLLVPLLIEVAAPLPGNPRPSAVLSDMALKLITHLASGQAAPAFKATVAALPLGAKQRLQQALQGGSGSGGAGGSTAGAQTAAAHAGAAKPSIQLKSFAALKPAS